jgi:AsmA-like protein
VKYARWFIVVAGGVLAALWIAVLATSRGPILRDRLVQTLSDRLDADVALESLEVKTFPLLRIHGDGLRVRLRHQEQPTPLIQIDHFEVTGGIFGLLHRPRRFNNVELRGLRITVPPKTDHDRESGNQAAAVTVAGPILIDHVVSDDAQLVLMPKDLRKEPKVFAIHHLTLEGAGFDRAMPFRASLSNPIPQGNIDTSGSFGPWVSRDPGSTPVSGHYTFEHADLSTISGIAGMLNSSGEFAGQLDEIDVRGTSTTPDFQIEDAGAPVPLDTRFHVVVDGTNGDTYLKEVKATFLGTSLSARGAIVAHPGVKGRTVSLSVDMPRGKLEDVLKLAVRSTRPVMLGAIALTTELLLPPGKSRVVDRLQLEGRFALERARFTDTGVQQQIVMLSRRSQGKSRDDGSVGHVVSNMRGRFVLRKGTVRFDPLAFKVPGADIQLRGQYGIRSEQLDFEGTMAMDAPISKAAGGGIKSILLKPFDPLFRRKGAAALLPLKIHGTRKNPQFGMDWKRALTRK